MLEKCGLAGVYQNNNQPASEILYNLLLGLYHRGREGAGISVYGPPTGVLRFLGFRKTAHTYKNLGRVRDVFDGGRRVENLVGHVGIGQTRYGTIGLENPKEYLHPIKSPSGKFYLAHNGTIAPHELEGLLKEFPNGSKFDTQLLTMLLERSLKTTNGDWLKALEISARKLDGSYTCAILEKDRLIAFREPRGLKPLNIGELEYGFAIASETSALDTINAKNIEPVKPGEVIIIDKGEVKRHSFAEPNPTPCAFEFLYFSDVGSKFDGTPVYDVRTKVARILAGKDNFKPDIVIPVPDSGRAGADGYGKGSGAPYSEGIRINREVGRIFIMPKEERDSARRQKYLPIEASVKGKIVVVVDDSVVRGDTTEAIDRILHEAGASEVHVRSTFPEIRYPCLHGGVAFASQEELAINKFGGREGLRKHIKADSLVYPTVEDLKEAGIKVGCFACITGKYPLNHQPDFSTAKSLGYVMG
jgi:amidophosphoribosyltransferase